MAEKTVAERSLELHEKFRGKIEIKSRVPVKTKEDLSLAYTPGVAQPCLEIQKDISKSYVYTNRWNTCLVVTDGTAVLGLGAVSYTHLDVYKRQVLHRKKYRNPLFPK